MSLYDALMAFNILVLIYFVLHNVGSLGLLLLSWRSMHQHRQRIIMEDLDSILTSPLAPSIAVLVPAYNEQPGIVSSVRSIMALEYSDLEVVVINDGSTDDTLSLLIDAFQLELFPQVYDPVIPTANVRGIWRRPGDHTLVVVDKENGGKADALNCGINVARAELVAMIDGDSILEPEALLRIARPFVERPFETVAAGGIIRIANGCTVVDGYLSKVALPKSHLARFQTVEYLRAFLGARAGWARINALLIISGAFGVFDTQTVRDVGGLRTDTVGEDSELVVRLHHALRKEGYRIEFIPDPVCWTEVPEDLHTLRIQRQRWHRGLGEVLWIHRRMMCNPRYRSAGLLAMPFFLLFELLGPVIELIGLIAIPLAWYLGIINAEFLVLFLVLSTAFGVLLSIGALALEESALRRYPRIRDALMLAAYGVAENFGYRQMLAVWRGWALVQLAARSKVGWGEMKRKGFDDKPPEPAIIQSVVAALPAAPAAPATTSITTVVTTTTTIVETVTTTTTMTTTDSGGTETVVVEESKTERTIGQSEPTGPTEASDELGEDPQANKR